MSIPDVPRYYGEDERAWQASHRPLGLNRHVLWTAWMELRIGFHQLISIRGRLDSQFIGLRQSSGCFVGDITSSSAA
jgi:hypothetical protein